MQGYMENGEEQYRWYLSTCDQVSGDSDDTSFALQFKKPENKEPHEPMEQADPMNPPESPGEQA